MRPVRAGRRATVRTLALLGLAVAVMTSGCASIPDHGAIRTNESTAAATEDQVIRVLVGPPAPGASPEEVVEGFLAASASFEGDHSVARSYLTSAASTRWKPNLGVAVYDTDAKYELADDGPGTVRMLAFRSAGRIDARGQFSQPTTAQFRATFTLTRVEGEYRIDNLPDGLILGTGDIARAYRSVNLYFLDPTGSVLVPDPIHVPIQQQGVATALTRQLLAGPTSWLAPAVRTAVPKGTKLAVDSVPVEDGVAQVDLDRAAVAVSSDDRRALAAQVTWTLTQLPGVRAVQLTLNGVSYSVPGIGTGVSTTADWSEYDPNARPLDNTAYALVDGRLMTVESTSRPVSGYFGGRVGLTRAAVSSSGRYIAGAVPDGSTTEVRFGSPGVDSARVAYRGQNITGLSFDRFDVLWVAERSGAGSFVSAVGASTPLRRVKVEGLGGRTIEDIRVSRDGARVAFVLAPAGGGAGSLYVGRVERSTSLVVSGLRRIEDELSGVRDVAWAGDSSIITIARRGSETLQAFTVGIDGNSVSGAGSIEDMRSIAASPGRPHLAGTGEDMLWIDGGNGWRTYLRGTTPLYAG